MDFIAYFVLGRLQAMPSLEFPDRLMPVWKWALGFTAFITTLMFIFAVWIQGQPISSTVFFAVVTFIYSYFYCFALRRTSKKWQWWTVYVVGALIGGSWPFILAGSLLAMLSLK